MTLPPSSGRSESRVAGRPPSRTRSLPPASRRRRARPTLWPSREDNRSDNVAIRISTAERRQQRDVMRFLALTPDARLRQVAQACRMGRREASWTLDQLIVEDLVRIRRPGMKRFLSALLFTPLGLFFVAERYSLTHTGLLRVAH